MQLTQTRVGCSYILLPVVVYMVHLRRLMQAVTVAEERVCVKYSLQFALMATINMVEILIIRLKMCDKLEDLRGMQSLFRHTK